MFVFKFCSCLALSISASFRIVVAGSRVEFRNSTAPVDVEVISDELRSRLVACLGATNSISSILTAGLALTFFHMRDAIHHCSRSGAMLQSSSQTTKRQLCEDGCTELGGTIKQQNGLCSGTVNFLHKKAVPKDKKYR